MTYLINEACQACRAGAPKVTEAELIALLSENHHPAILTEWGKVTVTWWTHKIGGLHKNDFVMAARTDQLYPD